MDIVFLVARILFGGFFIWHGVPHFTKLGFMSQYTQMKGVPAPRLAVLFTGLMLLAGGLSIALGYKVAFGSGILVAFLLPVAFIMHNFWTQKDPMARMNDQINFEKDIALAVAVFLLTFVEDWPLSLGA